LKNEVEDTWDGSYTGQKSDGGNAVTMLQFILSETIKEEKLAHTTEEKAQATYEDAMAASKLAEAQAEQRLTGFQEDLAETQQDKLMYEEDVTGLDTELKRFRTLLATTKDECAFILRNFKLRQGNRKTEVAALKNAVKLIRTTPAFKEAENAAELKSFGDCKEICQGGNDEHVKCKACQGGVTVSAYCVSHKGTPGCKRSGVRR
jgi:predicted enzyme involved in methoxymalonyl-ACP biosynthesis